MSVAAEDGVSLPTKPHAGIYRKYSVKRLRDPDKKHARCEYFVLDWDHDPFAVPAALAYADACEELYPTLARELRDRANMHAAIWAARGVK